MKSEKGFILSRLNGAHSLFPSVESLISTLQVTRKEGHLSFAKHVHTLLCIRGLECHEILGNYLVSMLVHCGCLFDAQRVFLKLGYRNEQSWASLMHKFIEIDDPENAFELYKKMQEEHVVCPSKYMLQSLLKACVIMKDVVRGQELYQEIVSMGVEKDPFVGCVLIDMYATSGSFFVVKELIGKLESRDVVVWTAIITAYVQYRLLDDAFDCIEKMQIEGVSPNAITFLSMLKGCGSVEDLERGHKAHNDVVKQGFERDCYIDSALVCMYSKCKSLSEAEKVFHQLPFQDPIVWTALISGYSEIGLGEEALSCLDQMRQDGQMPNAITYGCGLKACSCNRVIDKVREIHGEIVKEEFENDPHVGSMLVDAYGKCASIMEAQEVFDEMAMQDIVAWNSLISSYIELGFVEDALHCVEKMHLEGISIDSITCVYSLKACSTGRFIADGQRVHSHVVKIGFDNDSFIGSLLVDMYAKCALLPESWVVFEKLSQRNGITWTALITGYIENGLIREALNCLEAMQSDGMTLDVVSFTCGLKACSSLGAKGMGYNMHSKIVKQGYEKDSTIDTTLVHMYMKCSLFEEGWVVFNGASLEDLAPWTALMNGYMDVGLDENVLDFFEKMPKSLIMDSVSVANVLKACGNVGALCKGQEMHVNIAKRGLDVDASITSSLVDMYSKCGSLEEAWELLDENAVQNVVLWTTLMTGYACQGITETVLWIFERMMKHGIKPDGITLLNIATVFSHAGLVEYGTRVLMAVNELFGSVQTIELHNCLIDMLTRVGQVEEAMKILQKMPFQPNVVTWNTILGTCQKGNFMELGTIAFQCATALDPRHHVPYISMFNIYAHAHMWEKSRKVECMRILCVG